MPESKELLRITWFLAMATFFYFALYLSAILN